MTNSVPQPETIQKLGAAPFPAFAMVAGMQLELFTPLGTGAMTAEQLAKALGVGDAKLTPLLYALVSVGLLTVDDGRFANTLEADRYLVRGKPTYLGDRHLHYAARYYEAAQTAATIRTGQPQAKRDFASLSTEEFDEFLRGLHPAARAAGRDLVTRFDFSGYRNMMDVAGGSGGLAETPQCPSKRHSFARRRVRCGCISARNLMFANNLRNLSHVKAIPPGYFAPACDCSGMLTTVVQCPISERFPFRRLG